MSAMLAALVMPKLKLTLMFAVAVAVAAADDDVVDVLLLANFTHSHTNGIESALLPYVCYVFAFNVFFYI